MHPQIAERIVNVAQVPAGVPVLEIGPGTGMLTRALLGAGYRVIAVEADDELIAPLRETFASEIGAGKLTVIHEDIRAFDTASLPRPYALIANIPYYITGEIIRTFLTAPNKPQSMTLLVQKEVAERIARLDEKRPKESLLSLSVKVFGKPEYCFTVPRGAFRPAPNVDSAVLAIRDINPDAFANAEGESAFFNLVRAGFAHKRKQLGGNLALHYPPEHVRKSLATANISEKTRSEDLSLADWLRLLSYIK
jgi:16S rRNA (adenine1518-N6/adenine1519-N6)-dimethyltransferase